MQTLNKPSLDKLISCNPNELNLLVLQFLPNAKMEEREVIYFENQDWSGDSLSLEFTVKGKVLKCTYTNKNIIDKLLDAVECELLTSNIGFSSEPVFTSVNLKSEYFRFENKILLRPINDVVQNEISQSIYPAVLEFAYNNSSNPIINIQRRIKAILECVSLLNFLFEFKIETISGCGDYYGYKSPPGLDSLSETQLFRQGYEIKDFVPILEHLVKNDENPLLELGVYPMAVEDFHYLSGRHIVDDEIVASDFMYDVLNCLNIENDKNEEFKKAIYWFSKAKNTNPDEPTQRIIKLATCLETLIDKSSNKCDSCKQELFSIGAKVKNLVSEFCTPILSKDNELLKLITHFYSVRSSAIHGLELPFTDIPNSRGFDPLTYRIIGNLPYFTFIVKLTMLNWYFDRAYDEQIEHLKRLEWISHTPILWYRSNYKRE